MILIRSGYLIDAASGQEGEFDLLLDGQRITAKERPGTIPASKAHTTIDAAGKWIMPGLIDMHVHFREPGFEWKETIATGSRAAVLGGYTSVCCMPNTQPINDCREVTEFIIEKARNAQLARVYPIGAASVASLGKELAPLSELRKAGCIAFSDDGEPIYDGGLMRRALEWCLMLDVPICCHEEDKSISCRGSMNESALSYRLGLHGSPSVAEDVMVARDIELARYTGGKVHICHVSTARSVELIRRAKQDGIRVTAEVTPHHLLLSEGLVVNYDANYKMNPPLRTEEDCEALCTGLEDGTIDVLASDHAPHEEDSKRKEFEQASFGILGLQTSLPLMIELVQSQKLSKLRMVQVLASEPAKILGLETGSLAVGALADLCIVDPDATWTFERNLIGSKSFNSPFIGRELKGRVDTVLVDGRIVVSGAKLNL